MAVSGDDEAPDVLHWGRSSLSEVKMAEKEFKTCAEQRKILTDRGIMKMPGRVGHQGGTTRHPSRMDFIGLRNTPRVRSVPRSVTNIQKDEKIALEWFFCNFVHNYVRYQLF